jgi:hypothetical protein
VIRTGVSPCRLTTTTTHQLKPTRAPPATWVSARAVSTRARCLR